MTTAFLETTVLTKLLLKKDGSEEEATALLSTFAVVIVPQFAWKEFKRGPLANFRWMHNKLAATKSYAASMAALQRMSRSPRGYLTSTAIQALHTAFVSAFKGIAWEALGRTYGKNVDADVLIADALRLKLKQLIFYSWGQRKTLFGGQKKILTCYPDIDIKESMPLLDLTPIDCPNGQECCLKTSLVAQSQRVAVARAALASDDGRQETTRRRQFLRQIERHPQTPMGKRQCQQFGDAYFVLFCPNDAVIITTNERDIKPMADALNIAVANPTATP
jgi:hypothetical protein